MPAWIEQRAARIRHKNPDMPESQSWAIATQQAYKMGKTPKGYGTKSGKREARMKYGRPRREYQKTASVQMAAFSDEFVKIARSLGKDFLGGIDPTGGATFQYGMQDVEKPGVVNPNLARAAGTAGGVVGGALVVPSAISGLIGAGKGLASGGSIGSRLAQAGRGFMTGVKAPVSDTVGAIRAKRALGQVESQGAKSLTEGQLKSLGGIADHSPLGSLVQKFTGKSVKDIPPGQLRMLMSTLRPKDIATAKQQVGSQLTSGLATLGTSGLIGGGSAYLQYGKGRQAAEKYLGQPQQQGG